MSVWSMRLLLELVGDRSDGKRRPAAADCHRAILSSAVFAPFAMIGRP